MKVDFFKSDYEETIEHLLEFKDSKDSRKHVRENNNCLAFGKKGNRKMHEQHYKTNIKFSLPKWTIVYGNQFDENRGLFEADIRNIRLIKEMKAPLEWILYYPYGVCMLTDSDPIWTYYNFTAVNKYPKRHYCPNRLTKTARLVFERHGIRHNKYTPLYVAVDKFIHPVVRDNTEIRLFDAHRELRCLIAQLSALSTCAKFWTINIKKKYHEHGVVIPADLELIKAFCDLRKKPKSTKTGKRNPILHLVSEHLRKTKTGTTKVSPHYRGIKPFEIDDYEIQVIQSLFEVQEVEERKEKIRLERNAKRREEYKKKKELKENKVEEQGEAIKTNILIFIWNWLKSRIKK